MKKTEFSIYLWRLLNCNLLGIGLNMLNDLDKKMLIEDYIETPENVELRRKLAGIGLRLQAGLIDTLVLILAAYLPLILLFIFLGFSSILKDNGSFLQIIAITFLILITFSVYWGYFLFFEWWMNGQTFGKRRMKIRVVKEEGQGVTLRALAIRNLLRVVDGIGGYAVAGISMFFSHKIQRLGDIAAGTIVISEDISDYSALSDRKAHLFVDEKLTINSQDKTALSPDEYKLLYNYWSRKDQLESGAKLRILPKILKPILDRKGVTIEYYNVSEMEAKVNELMAFELNSNSLKTNSQNNDFPKV